MLLIFLNLNHCVSNFMYSVFPLSSVNLFFQFLNLKKIYLFIFIQLQLSAFSPLPSTPPQPGGEGQIPHDLTFNWNVINKRKKQTKYNQRH